MPKTRSTEDGAQFVRYFSPVLNALRELGNSGTPREVVERVSVDLALSEKTRKDPLPSGAPRLRNQIAWARFYLVQEGLIDASKRGVWTLTKRGRATQLTPEQARELFTKWVRVFQQRYRAKWTPTPKKPS